MNDDYDIQNSNVDSSEILPFPDMLAPANNKMNGKTLLMFNLYLVDLKIIINIF